MTAPEEQPVDLLGPDDLLDRGTGELVAALAAVRGCWSPSLSPTGDCVAFVSDMDGDAMAYVTPTAFWDPVPVSPAGHTAALVAWSHDPAGSRLLISSSPPGSLRAELLTVYPDGSNPREVSGPPGGTAFAGCWAPGSASYAYTSVGPDGSQAVLLDVETGERRVLAEDSGLLVQDVTADGKHALVRVGPRGRRHIALTTDGRLTRLLPRHLPGGSDTGRLTDGGQTAWLRVDADREFSALIAVNVDTAATHLIAERDGADLEHWAVTADGRLAVLVWNVDGVSHLELLDPATGTRQQIDGPWQVIGSMDLSADGNMLAVEATGPAEPRALYILDLEPGMPGTATPVPLSRVPPPPVDTERLVRPTLVHLSSHDGLALSGWLYRPWDAEGPLPTVISLHGGPEAQERPIFSPLHQCLVAAGIAVLAPNVRGSTGYGRSFVERDSGLRRLDAVRDVSSCAQWLVESDLADPTRIGVHGTSYGGYLVLASIVADPSRFAAAASVCGISDFLTFFAGTEPWIAAAARTKYGDPDVDAALLRQISPLHGLPAAKTPTLLVHGLEDTNVPVGEARSAHAALLQGGVASELVELPGEGHSLLRPESRLVELTSVVRWFRRFL